MVGWVLLFSLVRGFGDLVQTISRWGGCCLLIGRALLFFLGQRVQTYNVSHLDGYCLAMECALLLLLGGAFNVKRSPAGWMLPVGCVGAALASAKMLQIVLMLSAGVMGDVVTYCLAQRASNHKRDICCIPVV